MQQRWLLRIVLIGLSILLLPHCSTLQPLHYDDALDIKPQYQFLYEVAPCTDTTNPDGNRRDGRTLRGVVRELVIDQRDTSHPDTFFVFINKGVFPNEQCLETIPLHHVILPATDPSMVQNSWRNINKIRSYNNVTGIPEIREVPVRIIAGCECEPLNLSLRYQPITVQCPKRQCSPIFIEIRAIPPIFSYADHPSRRSTEYRKAWAGEIAIGWRLGFNLSMRYRAFRSLQNCQPSSNIQEASLQALLTDYCYRWGIGIAFTSPLSVYNALSNTPPEDLQRPVALLHLRYQFDRLISCVRPFIYAQLGTALDRATQRLWKFQIRGDTEIEAAVKQLDVDSTCFYAYFPAGIILPSLQLQMAAPPLTWSLGVGLEFPLFSWIDIAADIGYRSLGIADIIRYQNTEIPIPRRLGLWRLRIGITL